MLGFESKIQAIQSAVEQQSWESARRMASTLVQDYPGHAHAWLWLAWLSEDPNAALGYAQRAATLDPAAGNPAVAWAEQCLRAPQRTSVMDAPALYTRKPKGQGIFRKWMQGAAMLATTGVVAIATVLWNGGMNLSAPTVQAAAGRYASVPVNLDRPNDPTLYQVHPPASANRAITISMEPTATSILASPYTYLRAHAHAGS